MTGLSITMLLIEITLFIAVVGQQTNNFVTTTRTPRLTRLPTENDPRLGLYDADYLMRKLKFASRLCSRTESARATEFFLLMNPIRLSMFLLIMFSLRTTQLVWYASR